MSVRFAAELICAAAESLAVGQQLDVNLKPDDGLIPLQHFTRSGRHYFRF
jgi:hypothetical protein